MHVENLVLNIHRSDDFEDDFAAGTALLQQGVGFGNTVERKDTAVERLDMPLADERKESVDGYAGREVGEEAGEEYAIGDVLDGVEMLDGKDIAQDTRVADVAGMRDCSQ